MSMTAAPPLLQQHWQVRGQVQGVGFRPFVYRLARQHGLTGSVWNQGDGVHIQLQGPTQQLQDFACQFHQQLPEPAVVDKVEVQDQELTSRCADFRITESQQGRISTEIVPDLAVCRFCLEEMLTPGNRRYRYPLINCMHCGPRFTIIRALPYDRPNTSMASFRQCESCNQEYHNPLDRRFHAQPNACPLCGPELTLHSDAGAVAHGPAALDMAAERLLEGGTVAIKGTGGFQLLADARNPAAVERLRSRKQRPHKPFAVMAPNLASARLWVTADEADARLLQSPAAPVVLLPARNAGELHGVALGLDQLGMMLANTPLHYLLFHAALGAPTSQSWLDARQSQLWLATSANLAGAPLVTDNATALEELFLYADLVLSHDRHILQRADDSVWQGGKAPLIIRRARGYAPARTPLGFRASPSLACGAGLKNTLCLARDEAAFLSQHIGDLEHPECCEAFAAAAEHLMQTLAIRPQRVICDLHPDLFSSRFAARCADQWQVPLQRIQHHHAHIGAVLAEHRLSPLDAEPCLGVALDGFGLGSDGTPWGGELLSLESGGVRRLGHLSPLAMPGADRAAREPWRMALAALQTATGASHLSANFAHQPGFATVGQMLEKNINCPPTSSAGRWFDAVAALLGCSQVTSFEGQAAMELEALARQWPEQTTPGWAEGYRLAGHTLDLTPAITRLAATAAPAQAAWQWHRTLVEALYAWISQAARETGCRRVAIGGGCLNNRLLRQGLIGQFRQSTLELLLPEQIPAGDGGLSLGQLWMAHFEQH